MLYKAFFMCYYIQACYRRAQLQALLSAVT